MSTGRWCFFLENWIDMWEDDFGNRSTADELEHVGWLKPQMSFAPSQIRELY